MGTVGGGAYGGDDARVTAAPADVAVQRLPHGLVVGISVARQQIDGAHQHSGRAIATLDGALVHELLLDRMQPPLTREALHGGDLGAVDGRKRCHAGQRGNPVDEHGASTTPTLPTPGLGAGQLQILTQGGQQGPLRRRLDVFPGAIEPFRVTVRYAA